MNYAPYQIIKIKTFNQDEKAVIIRYKYKADNYFYSIGTLYIISKTAQGELDSYMRAYKEEPPIVSDIFVS